MKKFLYFFVLAALGVAAGPFMACSNSGSNSGVTYTDMVTDSDYPSTFVTGIRRVEGSTHVYITGGYSEGSSTVPLLYVGPLSGEGGTWYPIEPSATLAVGENINSGNLYGPDNSSTAGEVNLVGTYQIESDNVTYGFYYSGPVDGSGDTWINIDPTSLMDGGDVLLGTVPHSNMNGVVVGNFDTQLNEGRTFIYNTATDTYYELTKTGTTSISAYGIWWNGGTSYTITGGYHDPLLATEGEVGYLVDWDSSTQVASNWQYYNFQNQTNQVTHFEGITYGGEGTYNLATGWITPGTGASGAAFAQISRNSNGTFGDATWAQVVYPGAESTTGNTVYLNNVLGVYLLSGSGVTYPYIATID